MIDDDNGDDDDDDDNDDMIAIVIMMMMRMMIIIIIIIITIIIIVIVSNVVNSRIRVQERLYLCLWYICYRTSDYISLRDCFSKLLLSLINPIVA